MTSPPAVSVIIPALNAELYIADTLTCLRHQGLSADELEVIVVDDGSTDSTAEIVESRRAEFPGMQMIRKPKPGGLPAARNSGMSASTGRHITFIDSDDWFADGHLRVMLDAIETLGVDFVRTDVIRATGKTRKLMTAPVSLRARALNTKDFIVDGFAATMVDFPNAFAGLYRRELWESGILAFDESLLSAEDREWNWRVFLEAETFAVVDSPGPVYRRNVPTSITAVYDERQLCFIDSCQASIEQTLDREEFRDFTIKAGHNLMALADIHLQRKSEMTREIQHELIDRTARAAAKLPEDDWTAILASMKPERRRRLAPIIRRTLRHRKQLVAGSDGRTS